MTRRVYGVVTSDPITGKLTGMQADIDMSLGTAAVIAESLDGVVVQAELGQWTETPIAEVEAAHLQQKDEAMDTEIKKLLGGEQ